MRAPGLGPRKGSAARTVLKVGLSGALLAWLLSRAGLGSIAGVIGGARPAWLVAAVVLGIGATAVQTTQWRSLLAALGLWRAWLRCLRLVYVGYAFNTVLPSAVGGDVVRAIAVAERPEERGAAATSVVLQRLCNFPGMMLLMTVGLLATLGDPNAGRVRIAAVATTLLGAGIIAVAVSPLPGLLAEHRLLSGRGRPLAGVLRRIDAFRSHRRQMAMASLRGTTFWSISVVNQWCLMRGVGIEASLGYAAVVVTTVNIMTLLPISLNGYGVREGGFSAFLAINGLASTSQALAMSLLLAAQTLLWGAAGILCWLAPSAVMGSAIRRTAAPRLEANA